MSHINIFLTTMIFSTFLTASESGKELFNDAKCMDCHNKNDFKHRKNKVNSFGKLIKSVRACAVNNDAEWFDDEVNDVAKYLNKQHYHYKLKDGD